MKLPRHIHNILAMIHAAGFIHRLGKRMRHMTADDAAVELFEFCERENLNPDTMEEMGGLNEDDIDFLTNEIVLRHLKTQDWSHISG